MSTLKFTHYEMPSASLGKLNPLPDLKKTVDAHASIPIDESTVTREESKYMGWGRVNGILPYLLQDGYDRKKKPRKWNAAILENDSLRAVFLPEIGGRLWSLVDKTTGKELLHKNPVFQPCNLGLRNAWVSGGVEWNIGIIGHTPFTVDSMFAEELALDDGTPVLRMFQYERIRRLVYRIEAMLPKDSKYLYVRVRIDNPLDEDTAVYWWSNIAVDEREDVRVLVPSDKSYRWGYGGNLSKVSIPYMKVKIPKAGHDGEQPQQECWDISRTTQLPQAMDFFFDIPADNRPWISAVGDDGYGFVQTSTDELRGRKLFVWGMGAGGRNWQTFLSQPGHAYLELQAGLARTQLEHLPMKANETISWMEAYGPISAEADIVHGSDWDSAAKAIEESLEKACPQAMVDDMHQRAKSELDGKAGDLRSVGEGWALVDRELLGERFRDVELEFPRLNLGEREEPWLKLVREGSLPCPEVLEEPGGYQIGSEWESLLEKSIKGGGSRHWYGYYQHGVMLAHGGRMEEAEVAFDKSLECEISPWALRSKALLRDLAGDQESAARLLLQAVVMLPEPNIAKETLQILSKAGLHSEIIELYHKLPEEVKGLGRLKVILIEALLDTGDIDGVEDMLKGDIELTDVREGEVKLTDLWFRMTAMKRAREFGVEADDDLLKQVQRECTPPLHLDFRMH